MRASNSVRHIQASTLPVALTGKDVAGQAQTGTGKTRRVPRRHLREATVNGQADRRPA